MIFTGKGVERDVKRAIQLYQQSADLGERAAMFIMGEFLKKNNKNLAAYWYGKSHVRGYSAALNRLVQLSKDQ